MPPAHESVSLQLSPGREQGSLPRISPDSAPLLQGSTGPAGLGAQSYFLLFAWEPGGRGLLAWQPGEPPPAPGLSQGWGSGGHLCSGSFIQLKGSDWQPWLETDKFCVPDPENVYLVPAWTDRSGDFAENSRFFASLGKGRACGHTGRAFLPGRMSWSEVTQFR